MSCQPSILNSTMLSKSLLAKNIPLGASSTELGDVILKRLQRDEERAVELGIGALKQRTAQYCTVQYCMWHYVALSQSESLI